MDKTGVLAAIKTALETDASDGSPLVQKGMKGGADIRFMCTSFDLR